MRIELIDITPEYLQYAHKQRKELYFAMYPELFQHYYQYWADPGDIVLLTDCTVKEKVSLIKSRLPFIENTFTSNDFADKIYVVLFVGANTTNGHAFWDKNRQTFVVWLPVEAYTTTLQVDVFVTHEIIHALHYNKRPDFYFQDKRTKYLTGRQIVTEGIATWGTQFIMGYDDVTALWADYASPSFTERWYKQCCVRLPIMAQRILEEWNDSHEENAWFSLWDENDVTRYRGGYYVGLEAIKKICEEQDINFHLLLSLEKHKMETLVLKVLRQMPTNKP